MGANTEDWARCAPRASRATGRRARDGRPVTTDRRYEPGTVEPVPPGTAVALDELADRISEDAAQLLYVVGQDLAEAGIPDNTRADGCRHHLSQATALLRAVADELRTMAASCPDRPR